MAEAERRRTGSPLPLGLLSRVAGDTNGGRSVGLSPRAFALSDVARFALAPSLCDSVSGELAEFHGHIQALFPDWNQGHPDPHIELLLHS